MSQPKNTISKEDLWKILIDTVHSLPMYKYHKHYVQNILLKEKPAISPQELAIQINIPLGEAIIMLDELQPTTPPQNTINNAMPTENKKENKTLFDYK